ncbi:MAG: D-glycero-beta-D-manno-heptose 1,7-bisphosphate 7-phosphatase [Candidatus Thiodiazotropha sp. (ex Monitilora ramsayi)]|nr:D-glycero-beta-D-manno-heptose 1,7-bisphosphate 7-phosphatase [Candidatus Thiodiazotropha sp. (ex Monitilora ramsayi)]
MVRKALFLDRDGVVNVDHAYVYKRDNFEFIEGVFDLVSAAHHAGYLVIVVTNQSGIGRGYFKEADFIQLMDWVSEQFVMHGGKIDKTYFCPDHPVHGIGEYRRDSGCRKPAPGMLLQATREFDIDMKHSLMVGDKPSDMAAAESAEVGSRLLFSSSEKSCSHATAVINDLSQVIPYLL